MRESEPISLYSGLKGYHVADSFDKTSLAYDSVEMVFSLKICVILLVVITGVSIAGTLISPLDRALALVYYTWWYKSLLLLLALTMACATWRNVVEVVLPAFHPRFLKNEAAYRNRKPGAALGDSKEPSRRSRRRFGRRDFVRLWMERSGMPGEVRSGAWALRLHIWG